MAFNIVKTGVTLSVRMALGNGLSAGGLEFHFLRDDGKGASVALNPVSLAKMVQVFRGECESIDDGRGLRDCGKRFCLSHMIDPNGYKISVERDGGDRYVVFLDMAEALVLCLVIEHSMPFFLFGEDLGRLY